MTKSYHLLHLVPTLKALIFAMRYLLPILFLLFTRTLHAQDTKTTTIQHLIDEAEIPGISIASFTSKGSAWSAALGVKNAESEEAVNSTTIFEAASLSKPVVAYAALRMIERGELDLDQPLWETLAYDRLAHDERAKKITTRMVLSHTSGLPNWGGTPLDLNRAPGEAWGYSGEGFVYMQHVMEKITGRSLNEIIKQEVFVPLGMPNSSFIWKDQYEETAANGHGFLGEAIDFRKRNEANAAASLLTTATDYATFMSAFMSAKGISEEGMSASVSRVAQVNRWNTTTPVNNLYWGLGWGLSVVDNQEYLWHWGDNGQFRAFVVASKDKDLGVVYFTNSTHGLSIVNEVLALFELDATPATGWLDYWSYDDPQRRARISLRRAFTSGSAEEGVNTLIDFKTTQAEVVDYQEIGNLVSFLIGEQLYQDAQDVLAKSKTWYPDSSQVFALEGDVFMGLRAYKKALQSYTYALQLDPEREEDISQRIDWLNAGMVENPPSIDVSLLETYAGSYGPRKVTLESGELFYVREGSTSKTRLMPLSDDLFALESMSTFRIQFVLNEQGDATKIVGLYANGNSDESLRDK